MNTPTPPILTKPPNKPARKVKAFNTSITPKFYEKPKIKPSSLNLSSSSAFKHNFKPSTFTDIPPSHEEVLNPKVLTSTLRPSFSIKRKSTPLSISSSSAFKHNFKPSTFTDIPPSHEEVLNPKALTSTIRPSFSSPLRRSSTSAFSKKTLGGKYKKSRKLRKLKKSKKSKTLKNKIYTN